MRRWLGFGEVPYWRLSQYYLLYFGLLGALVPYWALYLKSIGFSSAEIGGLMSVIMLTKLVAPYLWGWVADRSGRRMGVVRVTSALAGLAFAGAFWATDYWWLGLVMLAFSFFWNAGLPQFEANTFNHLGTQAHRYSHIRIWGSVGFIIAVVGLGFLLERVDEFWLLPVLMSLFVALWLSTLLVPERGNGQETVTAGSIWPVLAQPAVIALFGVCFLMQASHGPYYSFYSIYLEEAGYGRGLIGQLWALGVIAEVIVFLFTHRLVRRFGLRRLLIGALALAGMRWLMVAAFVESLPLLAAAQTLHAASFGIYHAAAIQLVHRAFPGTLQGRGQALYSSLSFGAGGSLGIFLAGRGWDALGGPVIYVGAALACFLAIGVAWRWVREDAAEPVPYAPEAAASREG